MDWSIVWQYSGPLLSAIASLLGVLGVSKLISYRVEQLEKDFKGFATHIEELITMQVDVNNIKKEIQEFKDKEDKNRGEIREDIEKLQEDVGAIKGQVGDLTVQVTKLEGEVDNVRTLVKVYHGS